ncbi:MAG: HAMP domain-containing histidine kinase [candidate division Zixibacteria bacterium]|nr:HAMP domain-containing histidine kinase [candidate division Zixibacteria bacterium]
MALKKKSVTLIVVFIVIALTGLTILQSALISNAYTLKEQAFRDNVQTALNLVSQGLMSDETVRLILDTDTTIAGSTQVSLTAYSSELEVHDSARVGGIYVATVDSLCPPPVWIDTGVMFFELRDTRHVEVRAVTPDGAEREVIVDTIKPAGHHEVDLRRYDGDDINFEVQFRADSGAFLSDKDGGLKMFPPRNEGDSARRIMIRSVMQQLNLAEAIPIEKRLDSLVLDSLIAASLKESGVDIDYRYGVVSRSDDSLRITNAPELAAVLKTSEFSTRLFPYDIFGERNDLVVYFPRQQMYVWQKIGPVLLLTAAFMLVIVGCFVYSIRMVLTQKRLSGLLVEFINNMTHEFKTPISTVQLACEAIDRPDVGQDRDHVLKYNAMIQSENRRMRQQVDRILQMAVLEEGDYELNTTDVDIHKIIGNAVDAVALHVQNRGGAIEARLQATSAIIAGDSVHLSNIIHNLLDNANKYSPENPRIVVGTQDTPTGILITVRDNGIGISPADQKSVFDKYFRVSSGDVHNVKGFGLGLSYVRLMVEAHGGTISLRSTPGSGTEIRVALPVGRRGE